METKIQYYKTTIILLFLLGKTNLVLSQNESIDSSIVDTWVIESQEDWQTNMARHLGPGWRPLKYAWE